MGMTAERKIVPIEADRGIVPFAPDDSRIRLVG